MLKQKLGIFALALVPLAIGLVVGVSVPVDFIRDKISARLNDAEPAEDDGHGATESNAVQLSQTSQEGMQLKTGRVKYSDYQSEFSVPAFVREIPGANDLHVSSRFAGLVKRVLISEGQNVVPGQPILEIELTGDLLATAQAELLDAQQQMSIVDQVIARLEPTVRSGGVASKRLLDSRYERDRLAAKIETKIQEMLVRGISQQQIDEIIRTRKLLRSVTINVPEDLIPPQLNADRIMAEVGVESFLVERLLAKPGSMTELGQDLCELSYHAVLVVEGHAYEKDLPRIRETIAGQNPVSVSIGPEEAHEHLKDLRVAYLSNHVDDATNTYPFYIYLKNENLFRSSSANSGAGEFTTWKWKPGQRAHVEIADQVYSKSVVIPREALAVDGLKNYVYRWAGIVECSHAHDPAEAADHDEGEHEIEDKFEAVEVVVLHKDRRSVVIQLNEDLALGDRIAFNNASRLLFAMQSGSGGSANDHGHSH